MPSQWLKNLGHKASHVKLLRPLYDAQLGKRETHLIFESYPANIMGGDAGHGRWIASGQIDIRGKRIPFDQDHWFIGNDFQNTPFFIKTHQFDFLPELKALGGDMGRKTARQLTWTWMNDFESYHHLVWNPSVTAHRLVNWLMVYPFAFEQADDVFLDVFHNAFYRQFQHLVYTLDHTNDIDLMDRFDVVWGLIMIGTHCSDLAQGRLESWLVLLKGAVEDIAFKDGGVMTHNPLDIMTFAIQISQLKQSLTQTGYTSPVWLGKAIETTVRALNHLCHSDKNLTAFQGAVWTGKSEIEKLNRLANIRIRRGDIVMEESGYSVIRKGKTSVIVNHGLGDYTAPNAFEMGYGGDRVMVGCGTHFYDEVWAQSLMSIHAHSGLSVDGSEPQNYILKSQIESMNGACLWSGTHGGYQDDYQLNHTRRLYVDREGHDVRGEDVLVRSIATQSLPVTARFHLHPAVKTSLVNDGASILLQLPSGVGWMFEATNALISLEDSIYMEGDGFTPRKTSQILLKTEMGSVSDTIKWAVRRI